MFTPYIAVNSAAYFKKGNASINNIPQDIALPTNIKLKEINKNCCKTCHLLQ